MTPCVITVALTGSVPRKKDNPAVPIHPEEQIESCVQAYEAGAALAHIHAREADESPSSDPLKFAAVQEGIRKRCPGMIVQFSTGGRGRSSGERGSMLGLRPDMASLATGSVNFATTVYENSPSLIEELARAMRANAIKPEIEVFDLAMLYAAARLIEEGLIGTPPHVQFVMGIKNALPAQKRLLHFLVSEYSRLFPEGTWTAAGIGRHQLEVATWALELGGHVRTGLEDNLLLRKGVPAGNNAELVQQVAEQMPHYGRRPATPEEAREILRLPRESVTPAHHPA